MSKQTDILERINLYCAELAEADVHAPSEHRTITIDTLMSEVVPLLTEAAATIEALRRLYEHAWNECVASRLAASPVNSPNESIESENIRSRLAREHDKARAAVDAANALGDNA